MSEWTKCKLGDILNFRRGHDLPRTKMERGDIPVAGSNGIIGYHNEYTPISPCITIGRSGNIGKPYIYDKCWAHNTVLYVDDFKGNDPLYLYYLLQNLPLSSFSSGSAVPTLNRNHIHPLILNHTPEIFLQHKIASILKSLDDKIECNRKINENLEQQAQALFKSWFVDFEPFRNQPFVDSELGKIPQGWKVGSLFDVAVILDKQRKPLSGQEREKMAKIYPYYGATCCMDYVEDYIFDGIYTLIGEDGSVVTEDGYPFMQYVWGKFWVNNHAHILQGKNGFTTEMLHVLLSKTNINHLVTGAVQAKLSQANMQKIQIPIPNAVILAHIRPLFDKLYTKKRQLEEESRRLAELRDTLLPRLMSGELKVNEISNE